MFTSANHYDYELLDVCRELHAYVVGGPNGAPYGDAPLGDDEVALRRDWLKFRIASWSQNGFTSLYDHTVKALVNVTLDELAAYEAKRA